MVLVDHHRCAYCGGCVSVCPVEALTLAETRLVVNDDCIDCGDCVAACPVGALRPEPAELAGGHVPPAIELPPAVQGSEEIVHDRG